MASDQPSRDAISVVASIGAPILVGILLVYRIAAGHWSSVAFMALILAAVVVFYFFIFPGDDFEEQLDEDSHWGDS
jgi:membrane protein YdbS with pleckstrin-like domain